MAAAAATMAGRSTFLGTFLRPATAAARNPIAPAARTRIPLSNPNLSSLRQTRISNSPSRLLRRELSTFQPFHSITASACLVSKLPTDVTASYEGRFANYVSPI